MSEALSDLSNERGAYIAPRRFFATTIVVGTYSLISVLTEFSSLCNLAGGEVSTNRVFQPQKPRQRRGKNKKSCHSCGRNQLGLENTHAATPALPFIDSANVTVLAARY